MPRENQNPQVERQESKEDDSGVGVSTTCPHFNHRKR